MFILICQRTALDFFIFKIVENVQFIRLAPTTIKFIFKESKTYVLLCNTYNKLSYLRYTYILHPKPKLFIFQRWWRSAAPYS